MQQQHRILFSKSSNLAILIFSSDQWALLMEEPLLVLISIVLMISDYDDTFSETALREFESTNTILFLGFLDILFYLTFNLTSIIII